MVLICSGVKPFCLRFDSPPTALPASCWLPLASPSPPNVAPSSPSASLPGRPATTSAVSGSAGSTGSGASVAATSLRDVAEAATTAEAAGAGGSSGPAPLPAPPLTPAETTANAAVATAAIDGGAAVSSAASASAAKLEGCTVFLERLGLVIELKLLSVLCTVRSPICRQTFFAVRMSATCVARTCGGGHTVTLGAAPELLGTREKQPHRSPMTLQILTSLSTSTLTNAGGGPEGTRETIADLCAHQASVMQRVMATSECCSNCDLLEARLTLPVLMLYALLLVLARSRRPTNGT
mmetsp:Transcript_104209/g.222730  ORF Transcript_104209/g.222730 Transcript_104209/m.222730 type:complete len:295 (+) Transcript_104209:607-1491(+)